MNIFKRSILISLLFLFSCSAQAGKDLVTEDSYQEEEYHSAVFGDWTVDIVIFPDINPLYQIFGGGVCSQIETKNQYGDTLGIICSGEDAGKCVPYVNFTSRCENMNEYSALVSTDSGSSCASMKCVAVTELYYLFLLPGNHLDYILSGNKYGMAYGTNDGFRAAHFSLNGSTKAFLEGKRLLDERSRPENKKKGDSDAKNTVL